jgi:hypothetical protein
LRPAWANSQETPISKINRAKWTGGVVQVVEHLLCKSESLSLIPSLTKKKQNLPSPGARQSAILRKFSLWLPLLAESESWVTSFPAFPFPFLLHLRRTPLTPKETIKTSVPTPLFPASEPHLLYRNTNWKWEELTGYLEAQIKFLFPNHFLLFFFLPQTHSWSPVHEDFV